MTEFEELLDIDSADRDETWEKAFFDHLVHSNLDVMSEEAHQGPDGWPYLFAKVNPEGTEPAAKVLDWLHDKGIGLVVNPDRETPDYVFPYGMIWNFKERKEFMTAYTAQRGGQIKLDTGDKIHAGGPSEGYLPTYARAILREFLKQQKIEAKVLVMGRLSLSQAADPVATADHYDLCFSLESLGNPPAAEHRGILEAISWFLPSHYSLMIASEKGLPPFHPL